MQLPLIAMNNSMLFCQISMSNISFGQELICENPRDPRERIRVFQSQSSVFRHPSSVTCHPSSVTRPPSSIIPSSNFSISRLRFTIGLYKSFGQVDAQTVSISISTSTPTSTSHPLRESPCILGETLRNIFQAHQSHQSTLYFKIKNSQRLLMECSASVQSSPQSTSGTCLP